MDLNVIFTFIRNNGQNLGEGVENDAINNRDRKALTKVLNALKQIREDDMQNMTERGIYHDDFPDEQIGVEGYSIDELIDHVEELIAMAPTTAEGGKRKSRRQRKSKKNKKSRKSRKNKKRHTRRHR
jgi:ribosomal protein L12E/L44/L45/RPP1/RPP2